MNYIAEANRFMYDDNYIVESEKNYKQKLDELVKKRQEEDSEHVKAVYRKDNHAAEYWKRAFEKTVKEIDSLQAMERKSKLRFNESVVVESESSVNKLKESLKINQEKLRKYNDTFNNVPMDSESKQYKELQSKVNDVKRRIKQIKSKLNFETAFNVEHHHTAEDIDKAYDAGHRGFKLKRDDPKFDEKYTAAHTKLYNNDHGIMNVHHKNKNHFTVHAY